MGKIKKTKGKEYKFTNRYESKDAYWKFGDPNESFTCHLPGIEPTEHAQTATLPDTRLWLNVMFEGIRSALRGDSHDLVWCFSTNDHVGSFIWICNSIGIDTQYLRQHIVKHREKYTRYQLGRYNQIREPNNRRRGL